MLWPSTQVVHTTVTDAGSIVVLEDRTTRSLHFDTGPVQSRMYLRDPFSLALTYTRHMMACLLFQPEPAAVLQAGLGGGSTAKFFWQHYPALQLDTLEASPDVVAIAHEFFELPRDERLRIHLGDAVQTVRTLPADAAYDLILLDAFEAHEMSGRVAQQGFLGDCSERLRPGGVLAMNLWSGRKQTYQAALDALGAVFDQRLLCLPVPGKANVIVLAFADRPELSLRCLRPRALTLSDQLELEFASFLRQLQRANLPGDRRLVLSR